MLDTRAVNLANSSGFRSLDCSLLVEKLHIDRSLQVDVPLYYVLFLQNLMQGTQLAVSFNDCLRTVFVHDFERWRVGARMLTGTLALLGPMNFQVSLALCWVNVVNLIWLSWATLSVRSINHDRLWRDMQISWSRCCQVVRSGIMKVLMLLQTSLNSLENLLAIRSTSFSQDVEETWIW